MEDHGAYQPSLAGEQSRPVRLATRRVLKLKTPLLALVCSIAAEVLLFGVALAARFASPPHSPVLASRFFGWFHWLPDWLVWSSMGVFKPFHDIESFQAQLTCTLMFIFFALVQWYLVFLVGMGLFRRFYRKTA